jgi:hypothetical protein
MNTIIHMQTAAKRTALVIAAATAITAAGFLTVPAPAQADPMLPLAPACSQYGFTGNFSLRQSNGYVVRFNSTGQVAGGQAFATGDSGDKLQGPVSGGVQGRDVDFAIRWNSGARGRYVGVVDDNGFVHGDTNDEVDSTSRSAIWDSTVPLGCITPAAPAPAPAPAPQPAPPAGPAAARLGVAVKGPTTLPASQSGTYSVNLSNSGDTGAPVELYVSFGGQLQQTGQVTPSAGVNCDVINNAGGTTAVHCTAQQLQSKATANIVVQGRGSAPGAGHLTVTINSSDPGAQFVQKSQGLNVSIT